ncbi:MAG: hypothetical protein RRY18_01895, partial [Clostridia bacterium]
MKDISYFDKKLNYDKRLLRLSQNFFLFFSAIAFYYYLQLSHINFSLCHISEACQKFYVVADNQTINGIGLAFSFLLCKFAVSSYFCVSSIILFILLLSRRSSGDIRYIKSEVAVQSLTKLSFPNDKGSTF